MKNILKYTFFASLVFLMGCDLDETQEVTTLSNLVWSDEFNEEGSPNPQKWGFDIGDGTAEGIPGWGNNELQYYTDRKENAVVENGYLLITAIEESFEGRDYTSARLTTEGLFEQQYGRFEARIRLPYGKGYWPAFWLLGNDCDANPWPACGEIDIMENVGDEPTAIFGTVHGPGFNAGESISKEFRLEKDRFDSGFHVFGIEWSPSSINYYVDDTLYFTLDREKIEEETDGEGQWVFDRPFYIILNIAVGGNLPGNPNAETIFPQSMLVDYVRVYQ